MPSPGITRLFPARRHTSEQRAPRMLISAKGQGSSPPVRAEKLRHGAAAQVVHRHLRHIPGCDLGTLLPPWPQSPTETTRPLHFIPPRLNVNSKQAAIGRVLADARGEGQRGDRAPKSRIKVFSISEADSKVTPRTRPSPPIRSYSRPHQGRNPHLP